MNRNFYIYKNRINSENIDDGLEVNSLVKSIDNFIIKQKITDIEKYKEYWKPGINYPKDTQWKRGPRGKYFYETSGRAGGADFGKWPKASKKLSQKLMTKYGVPSFAVRFDGKNAPEAGIFMPNENFKPGDIVEQPGGGGKVLVTQILDNDQVIATHAWQGPEKYQLNRMTQTPEDRAKAEKQKEFRQYGITARKYMGDDQGSWAVFRNNRPIVTGLTQREVSYHKNNILEHIKGKN